jgi:transcriptional regulator with XRE-family HTH domain
MDKSYERFEKLLLDSGETAYQVANETGVSQSTLSHWRTGRSSPKADKLLLIAKHFGVTVEYFLDEVK